MVGLHSNHNQESAVDSFIEKFGGSISSTLECFDRVIFKGHLPFQNEARLNGFVDHVLKIRRKDFLKLLERHSNDLVAHGKALAEAAGRPYEYKQGFFRKEALIDDLIRRDRLTEGLVAVLCVQETCKTVRLVHAQGRPVLVHARRPQRVLYFYYLDRDLGLMYVRIQSWFPFTVQVYVNGHSWLAQQMASRRIAFIQHDNAFTSIDNPTKAQRLADGFSHLPWVRLLDHWAKTVNPLLNTPLLRGSSYYWTTTQAEYSTDVLFASRDKLAAVYPRLLDHATVNFGAADILTFLGRKLSPQFLGEVGSDCKKQRLPGARIKHRMKNNWLKMYDKFGREVKPKPRTAELGEPPRRRQKNATAGGGQPFREQLIRCRKTRHQPHQPPIGPEMPIDMVAEVPLAGLSFCAGRTPARGGLAACGCRFRQGKFPPLTCGCRIPPKNPRHSPAPRSRRRRSPPPTPTRGSRTRTPPSSRPSKRNSDAARPGDHRPALVADPFPRPGGASFRGSRAAKIHAIKGSRKDRHDRAYDRACL
jgi:hypothetical protein